MIVHLKLQDLFPHVNTHLQCKTITAYIDINLSKLNLQSLESTMKTYICIVCGFVYDETAGRPEDGFVAGTLWRDVPATWSCPECGVAKVDFEMIDI